jgi:AbrB family looped-hinge helix DNA binding protein
MRNETQVKIMERTLVVQPNGQITLPAEWLEKHGIEPGSTVTLIESEQGSLLLSRVEAAMALLDQIGQKLKARGVTLQELMESGEEIRQQIYDETYGSSKASNP